MVSLCLTVREDDSHDPSPHAQNRLWQNYDGIIRSWLGAKRQPEQVGLAQTAIIHSSPKSSPELYEMSCLRVDKQTRCFVVILMFYQIS